MDTNLQPTKPPQRLNRPAESLRNDSSWFYVSRLSPALHPPGRPSHTHPPKADFGARRRDNMMSYKIRRIATRAPSVTALQEYTK